jgi:hypothetical protein
MKIIPLCPARIRWGYGNAPTIMAAPAWKL